MIKCLHCNSFLLISQINNLLVKLPFYSIVYTKNSLCLKIQTFIAILMVIPVEIELVNYKKTINVVVVGIIKIS